MDNPLLAIFLLTALSLLAPIAAATRGADRRRIAAAFVVSLLVIAVAALVVVATNALLPNARVTIPLVTILALVGSAAIVLWMRANSM
jgi:hypothetical protein